MPITCKELKEKYEDKFAMDEPIKYKKFLIYPVKMKDYYKFFSSVPILNIDKDSIADAKVISMSYLKFIISLLEEERKGKNNRLTLMLYTIFLMVFKDLKNISIRYGYDPKKKEFISLGELFIYRGDFEAIRKIILLQNIIDYDDTYIDPLLKHELEEVERIKHGNMKQVSLEKRMVNVSISSGLTLEEVKNLPIRKFNIYLDMIDRKLSYQIAKQAELSGFVEFKKKIPHYLYEEDEGRIADRMMSLDALKQKII